MNRHASGPTHKFHRQRAREASFLGITIEPRFTDNFFTVSFSFSPWGKHPRKPRGRQSGREKARRKFSSTGEALMVHTLYYTTGLRLLLLLVRRRRR